MNPSIKLKPILTQLGLNDIEIRAYLAALEFGPAPASELARQAGLNRITVYEALKRLSQKGIVKIRAKKGNEVKYFTAEDVGILKEKARQKKADLDGLIEKITVLEPQLRALASFSEKKPEVYFYEGKEGIRNVLLDTIKQNPKESLGFASADFLEVGFDKKFLEDYWKKRVVMKIPARGIMPKTKAALALFTPERNQSEIRQVKFIPAENYPFEDEIEIYGDNIGIISMKKGNEHGVIIRSKSIADSFRAIFELVWNQYNLVV
ncbi:MAG: helix-turn-helix domain-containing protein [bacterium]